MRRHSQLTGNHLVQLLVKHGWTISRTNGSHVILTCQGKGKRPLSVPCHKGKTLKAGMAQRLLKRAGISE